MNEQLGQLTFISLCVERWRRCSTASAARRGRSARRSGVRLAVAEGYIQRDPTPALFTPKEAKTGIARVMTRKEVEQHIKALDPRERVIDHLALFTGMRPGEILCLQRKHVAEDCSEVVIEQRLCRGDIDDPKTSFSKRNRRHSIAYREGVAGMDGASSQAPRGMGICVGEPSKAHVAG